MCFIKMVQSFNQLLKILVELPLSVTCSDHHYFCCDLHHLVNVKYQARVVQLGACQLAIPEIQVQTSHGENLYEQILISGSHKQEKAIANKDRAMPHSKCQSNAHNKTVGAMPQKHNPEKSFILTKYQSVHMTYFQ